MIPPPLAVAGNLTVSGSGSALSIGNQGVLSLGTGSAAQFWDGGRYDTQGTTKLATDAQFVLEPSAAAPQIVTAFSDTTFALGLNAQVVLRNGGYTLEGYPGGTVGGEQYPSVPFTIYPLDPNEAWDRVVFEGTDVTLKQAVIEGGATGVVVAASGVVFEEVAFSDNGTGVTVYEPGSATIEASTLRLNGVGLDVRSSAGTVVSGSVIEQNVTGVQSGALACYGATCPCLSGCRSDFTLQWLASTEDSTYVRDNTGVGVRALDATADITRTRITGNGDVGLSVSNATVAPFTDNVVEGNGSYGVAVLSGGDIEMGGPNQFEYGVNRVAANASTEVFVYAGGYAFLGSSTSNGRNSVYDPNGGTFFWNASGAKLQAVNTFWDSFGAPPSGAVTGFSPVVVQPVSDCDYTVDPPVCLGLGSRSGNPSAALGAESSNPKGHAEERGGSEALREAIHAVREALAAEAGSEEAAGLVRDLGALHRQDRTDALGEWAATAELLHALRAPLGAPGLPAARRASAEAALEVAAVAALGREAYDAAAALVTEGRPHVESESVERVLGLVEAHVEAVAGRYAEASALVASVAASEPEPEVREALGALAAVYAGQAGDGNTRGAATRGGPQAQQETATSEAGPPAEASLAVYPNPSTGRAVVAVAVPAPGELRLVVYDVLGRRVAVLADGPVEAGEHRLALEGARLPAGLYLVRAEVRGPGGATHAFTERLTLVE